jgi:hypothetical protein
MVKGQTWNMNKLVETKELKTDYWEELVKQKGTKPIPQYDDLLDTLYIYFSPSETGRIITHFLDANVALLYRYADKEIIGMRIDAFEKDFLPTVLETKVWRLSSVGAELNGLCDIVFVVERVKNRRLPNRINHEIKALEPVFA